MSLTKDIQDQLDAIPYAKLLGVEPLFMGSEFTLKLPYKPENIGNSMIQALHGGGIGGFMETCAICQIILSNPDASLPKPIGINIDYLRKGNAVDTFAKAQIFKQGSRVTNVRVRAWQESFEKPIAALTGHFLTGKLG